MTQAPEKEQNIMEVAQAQEGDGKDKKETKKFNNLILYLTTVPRSLAKFKKLAGEKRLASSRPPKISDPKYIASLEGPFGLGSLVFPAFQRFNNIDFFLFLYCLMTAAHGALFVLAGLSLQRMAEAFTLTELEINIMDLTDYFASFLVAIVVAFYGGRGNRSKWVAVSAFILGISSTVFALPFYKYEIIKPLEVSEDLCTEVLVETDCGGMTLPHRSISIYLFILGQCLHGMAGMPLYILGLTFIYDHVPTFSSGLYLGKYDELHNQTMYKADDLYYKNRSHTSNVKSQQCKLTVPKEAVTVAQGAHKLMIEKEKEPHSFDKKLKDTEFGSGLKDLYQAAKCLFYNPLLLCCSLCKTMEYVTFRGTSQFVPLYLENQFLLTPSVATQYSGLVILPAGIIGRFLGGIIVDRLELSCKNKIRFTAVTTFVGFLLFILILFVKCETVKFAGINEDYDGTGILGNLTAPCNEDCDCSNTLYASICGRDDTEYFSACYAGCQAVKHFHNEKTYYNCSCINEGLTSEDPEGHFVDATSGKCNTKCHKLPLFFAFYFSSYVFSSLPSIPITMSVLQVVPTHLNSLAMGVTFTIWRFIESVPVPPIIQTASTASCIYWGINQCGIRGHCWIYDKSKMIYMMIGLCLVLQSSSVFFSLRALYIFDRVVKGSPESTVETVMPSWLGFWVRATSGRRKLEGEDLRDLQETEEWDGMGVGKIDIGFSCRSGVETGGLDLGEKDAYFWLLI
ncbi:solute carrier organic anion transporter family member 6A1-like [Arvicola amphibius]|uniref:solute carrier organic anion transporter family member 6A1-like n=1 Tax=Arvicola amphibius TaxID=1047088 RepID=UPI001C09428C|nr:solute carrier organic anion transporter family member 6A1-like [Arvicola amphibius]